MNVEARFALSALAGIMALNIALALGMALWNDWFPPDATDVGVLTFVATMALLRRGAA